VAIYGVESWTLSKDIAKRLATFQRKVKVNENWRKRYDNELMQIFGY